MSFKHGDRVRIRTSPFHEVGTILHTLKDGKYYVGFDGPEGCRLRHSSQDELELEFSFKVGDRVRVRESAPFLPGAGVIISTGTNGDYYVNFDGENAGPWGRYIHYRHLELEPKPETKPEAEPCPGLRVGQRVRVLDTFPIQLSSGDDGSVDMRGWTGVVNRERPGDAYGVRFEGFTKGYWYSAKDRSARDTWYIDAKYLVAVSECVSDNDTFWIVASKDTSNIPTNHDSKEAAIKAAEARAQIDPGKRYYVLQAVGFAEATTAKFQELNKMKA